MQVINARTKEKPRLDIYIIKKVPDLSRAFVQKLLKNNKITVNKEVVKSGYKIRSGDKIEIDYDLNQIGKTEKISLPIIYEDTNVIVINKPIGVLSHSKGLFNPEATVETFIKDKINIKAVSRAGIVHRLDRATSGVMICAKNLKTQIWLQNQFSTRKVKKTYEAIVSGKLKNPQAIIDMPIGRNPKAPATFKVSPNGKKSQTSYKIIKEYPHFTLVELQPKTGRTHQLRVHLAHIGNPIVGDTLYKGKPADRLYLHAESLEITLPNGKKSIFSTPLPVEFNKFLKSDNE